MPLSAVTGRLRSESAKRYRVLDAFSYDNSNECLRFIDAVHPEYAIRTVGAVMHVLCENPTETVEKCPRR